MHIAFINPFVLAEGTKNLDTDSFKLIKKMDDSFRFTIFTQRRGIGKGFKKEVVDGFECYLFDFSKRVTFLALLDKIAKPILGIRKFFSDIWLLKKFIDEARPDILHIDNVWPWSVIAFFSLKISSHKCKVISTRQNTEHLTTPFTYPYRPNKAIVRFLNSFVYKNFFLRANSPLTKHWLIENGAIEEKIKVIPISLSENLAQLNDRNKKGFKEFISISRLTPMKGLDVLIEAFSIVSKKFPDIKLNIYGFDEKIKGLGSYEKYLKNIASKYGILNKNVFFYGPIKRDEVTNIMSKHYFNIVSSHGETLNLVVAECASVKVPSIVTNYTGISYWIEKYSCGLVTKCSSKDLAETIEKAYLLKDEEYTKIQLGLVNMNTNFHPLEIAKKLRAMYMSVSSSNPQG